MINAVTAVTTIILSIVFMSDSFLCAGFFIYWLLRRRNTYLEINEQIDLVLTQKYKKINTPKGVDLRCSKRLLLDRNRLDRAASCRVLGAFDVFLADYFRLAFRIDSENLRAERDAGAATDTGDLIDFYHDN